MTVLEQRFMERMPSVLSDLVDEIKMLCREVAALRADMNKDKEEESK